MMNSYDVIIIGTEIAIASVARFLPICNLKALDCELEKTIMS
jgi:hypothetical protein